MNSVFLFKAAPIQRRVLLHSAAFRSQSYNNLIADFSDIFDIPRLLLELIAAFGDILIGIVRTSDTQSTISPIDRPLKRITNDTGFVCVILLSFLKRSLTSMTGMISPSG